MEHYKGYAIYYYEDMRLYITDSWIDAKASIRGHPNIYKGVNSEEEIWDWLRTQGVRRLDIAKIKIREERNNGKNNI